MHRKWTSPGPSSSNLSLFLWSHFYPIKKSISLFSHTGLLAIPQLCQACSCLRVCVGCSLCVDFSPSHPILSLPSGLCSNLTSLVSLPRLFCINWRTPFCQFILPFLHRISSTIHIIYLLLCYFLSLLPTMLTP